jgi:predicted metal-dependent enzyme (double-stranded beta helix superfamily)
MNSTERHIQGIADLLRPTAQAGRDAAQTAACVGALIGGHRPTADLLTPEQRLGSPDRAAGHLLHAETDFSMMAIVWRPGQLTRIHDHLCWCVVCVVQGSELETQYEDHGDHLVETITTRNAEGSVSALAPPGDLHRIHNDTDDITISLHVYGIDLRVAGSSARRTYDAPVRTLADH